MGSAKARRTSISASGRIGPIGSARRLGRLIKTPAKLGAEAQRQRRTRLRQQITHAVKTEDMKIADHIGR
jgi:hypothetical protein